MKRIYYLIIAFSLFLFACNEEEFLDQKPHTPTDFGFYTSEDGAIQGINAAYDVLQLGEQLGRVELFGTVCSGDAMAGGEPGGSDQSSLQDMMKFSFITTNSYFINYWRALYRGIYRCNLVLYYLKDPVENFDEGLRNRLLGEATFLRGLLHFKLVTFYGGYPQLQSTFNNELKGVPFIDHVLLQEEWNQERPELDYTWERIEDDFAAAADLLPASYEGANVGRATSGAAKSMLAKTYLYQEKWQEAYDAAKEVINSGQYYLIGEDGQQQEFEITRLGKNGEFQATVPAYKWIWQPEANNCAESIFDVQHFQEGAATYPEGQEGNLLPQYYGIRAVKAYGLSGGEFVEMDVEVFWGFILPTKYFIETAYRDAQGMDGDKILDPRFKYSVITADTKVPFYYSNEELREEFPDSAYFSPYFNNPATGYATWKYFTDPYFDVNAQSLGDRPQNQKYFRFADLLLIGAEAAVHVGQNADALEWVNRVRTRARNSGNTGFPKNLSAVTLDDVYAERRVELAFEGHQFFDIMRTGRAQKVLKEDAMQYAVTSNPGMDEVQEQYGENFVIGRNEVWPIPQSEIDNTNGMITQNPGY